MYKDVKKKLIALVLSICMVATVIEVVPIVRAAADTEHVVKELQVRNDTGIHPITLTYKGDEFDYTGAEIYPEIESVIIDDAVPKINIKDFCKFETDNGSDPINAGNYTIKLSAKEVNDKLPSDYTENPYNFFNLNIGKNFSFQINAVEAEKLKVKQTNAESIIILDQSGAKPDLQSVSVVWANGTKEKVLDPSQYDVSAITQSGGGSSKTGTNGTFTVTLKKNDNFTNTPSAQVTDCTVAYDMNNQYDYFIDFKDYYNYTDAATGKIVYEYTGSDVAPTLCLYKSDAPKVAIAELSSSDFNISINGVIGGKANNAGTYTITAQPRGSDKVLLNGELFTGTFTKNFYIKEKTAESDLIVQCKNPDDTDTWLTLTGVGADELVMDYADGAEVLPPDMRLVKKSDPSVTVNYHIVKKPNVTEAGIASVVIEPDAGTNYSGEIAVPYFIRSQLVIDRIVFGNYTAGIVELPYTGEPWIPKELVIKNKSNRTLTEDSHYYVKYNYQVNGQFIKDNEITASEARGTYTTQMASVGKKQILIYGKGNYATANGEPTDKLEYTVLPEKMDGNTIILSDTSYFYDGTEKKPTVVVRNNKGDIVPSGEYRVTYDANTVSVGQHTVTVTALDGSNYSGAKSVTYAINQVSFDDAKIIDQPFTYNGKPIQPTVAIKNDSKYGVGYKYVLHAGVEYTIVDAKGATIQPNELPVSAGAYTLTIRNNQDNLNNIQNPAAGQTKTLPYTIEQKDINTEGFRLVGVNGDGEIEWNGENVKPDVEATSGLIEKVDYDIEYTGDFNKVTPMGNSGPAVKIIGKGNYKNDRFIYYKITPRSLAQQTITVDESDASWNASGYDINLKINDNVRNGGYYLQTADYDVEKVEYSLDGTNWSVNGNTNISRLASAGKYRITVRGKGDYKGTREIIVACGVDISNLYKVEVNGLFAENDYKTSFEYNGETQTPASIKLRNKEDASDVLDPSNYTISYVRDDGEPMSEVGTIYVVAIGNPLKGYCGKTVISNEKRAYYKIVPASWGDNIRVTIQTHGGIQYDPISNIRSIPDVKVEYKLKGVWKTLSNEADYTLNLDSMSDSQKEAYLQAGEHIIEATGRGNYEDQYNYVKETYTVSPISLNDPNITIKPISNNYADGKPTFEVKYKKTILRETDKTLYPVKYDYTCNQSGSAVVFNPVTSKYEMTYVLIGDGNYCDKREIQVEVEITDLASASFADEGQEPQEGQFYIQWVDEERLIKNGEKKEPKEFKIYYKPIGGGSPYALKLDRDYEIVRYGNNNTPGRENNFVTIRGLNGYASGERDIPCTLFLDIREAKFAEGSDITSGGAIDLDKFMKAYPDNLDSLVKLYYNLGGTDIEVTADHFDVSLNQSDPNGFGVKNLWITGTKSAPYYFAGIKNVAIETTGNLENATVTVPDVYFKGTPITASALALSVRVGNNPPLTRDVDYKVTDIVHNTTIGEATVTIVGLGQYRGTSKTQTFNILCSLDDVIVKIADQNNDWQLWEPGTQLSYNYTDGTQDRQGVQPRVQVYLPNESGDPGVMLDEKIAYTASYLNCKDAGNATIVLSPNENQFLTGTKQISYKIKQTSIEPTTGSSISFSYNQRVTYTGNPITSKDGLDLVVTDSNCTEQTLVEGRDYNVIYQDNNHTDVTSESRVTINAKNGNYTGTYTFSFEIIPKSINAGDITVANSPIRMTYTGDKIVPIIDLQQTAGKLTGLFVDQDYEIDGYYDAGGNYLIGDAAHAPSQPGSYFVGIKGINNYNSTRLIPYEIVAKDIKDVEVTFVSTEHCVVDPRTNTPLCTYDATAHEPAVKVSFEGQELSAQDYIVTYTNNVNAGQATVTISANTSMERPKFSGSVDVNFDIKARSITEDLIDYQGITDGQEFPFDGNPVEPTVSITDKGLTGKPALVFLQDYDITYEDDNDDFNEHKYAGEVTMKITGIGNYEGEKIFTFYIGEDISQAYALYNGSSSVSTLYNGLIQAPDPTKITVEKNGTSIEQGTYDIAYYKDTISKETKVGLDQFIDAGTYYITVVGVPSKGTYAKTPSQNCTYNITPKTIAGCTVSGYAGMYYYTGLPIQPVGITVTDTDLPQSNLASDGKRSVELVQNRDFTISYQNNNSAGKATIVATGIGNYTGTVYAYFTIENSTINNSGEGDSTSQGSISKDGMTTLTPDNIILTYDDSSNNFMRYTGAEVLPTVSFVGGYNRSDFEITGVNNVNPGKATLVIRGKGGNYSGAIYMYFNIKANLSTHGQMSAVPDQAYTGAILTPHVTVGVGNNVLTLNQDYQLTYSNNQNVGKATITAQGVGDYYYGSISTTFNISNGAGGMSVSGYASSYIYSGNAIEPDVTVTMNGVTLTKNRDYTVTYANNVNVGTATMTVRGIGSYSGTQTINYTIEAKNIENCVSNAIANVKYTGNTYTPVVALTDATTGKVLVQGSDYMITYSNNTNPGTASITITALSKNYVGTKVIPFKITSAAVTGLRTGTIKNNSIKLAWTSQSYADGYQICNAQNKVIATTANTSYTVKNLKSCTTYKYKVRSYVNNADGSMAYGDFSTAVSAKTLLNTPKLKAKSTKKGVVTLTWSKVSKATGYEIYYSTKRNGIYTKLKTVSSSSKRVYYDRGLATGEKYYYTIRAYRKVNGVKTYSNYNTIKAVTVK